MYIYFFGEGKVPTKSLLSPMHDTNTDVPDMRILFLASASPLLNGIVLGVDIAPIRHKWLSSYMFKNYENYNKINNFTIKTNGE